MVIPNFNGLRQGPDSPLVRCLAVGFENHSSKNSGRIIGSKDQRVVPRDMQGSLDGCVQVHTTARLFTTKLLAAVVYAYRPPLDCPRGLPYGSLLYFICLPD